MGNKKRILAWLLSLALVFGLFGGQASVVKAADATVSIYSMSIAPKELPSEGGKLTATIKFDDFEKTTGTVYYQLQKQGSDGTYAVVDGKDNVEAEVVNNTLDIDIPANTETTAVTYRLYVNMTSGLFETAWGTIASGAKRSTFTVAAKADDTDKPDTSKVLPDSTHFRARAVDKDGKPISGVKFDLSAFFSSDTITSDENGVIEKTLGTMDFGTYNVSLADNDSWTCDTKHSYYVNDYGQIEDVDGTSVESITDEVQFVLKVKINKKALKTAIDKASAVKNPDDYSAGYEELKTALEEANKVYANEDATQEEVDTQVTKLTAALDAVVVKSADKTNLKALIDDATQKKNEHYYEYTSESRSTLDNALTEANAIYKNDKAGQTAIDEVATKLDTVIKGLKYTPSLDSAERISDENVSSKGGEVKIKLIGKALDDMDIKAQVKDGTTTLSSDEYTVTYGEGSEERIATVTLPENTTSEEKTYTIGFLPSSSYYGWKNVTFKVAAGAVDPTPASNKCDAKTFRAKVVDEKGNPVEGVNVNLTGVEDSSISYDIKSDKDGMVTYKIAGGDFMLTFDAVVDDKNYTSEDEHEFETDGSPTKAPTITTVNGKAVAEADEVVFTVKKNASSEEDKVLSDANTFRAKIVDEDGNPVEGVKLSVSNVFNYLFYNTTASNEKGVVEYTINPYSDYDLGFDVTVAENQGWTSEQSHIFSTDGYSGNSKIISVDGDDIATTGEIVYIVKKAAVADKVVSDSTHFRAKVVDVEGNPVDGATFEVKVNPGKTHEITSNEKGVIEYALSAEDDADATITVKLKSNDTWATSDEYKIVTDAMSNIYTINGKANSGEELSYILRKKVDKTALGEALEKVKDLVESDYTEDSWSAYKLVLDKAQSTYNNDFVNKEDVDEQIQNLEAGVKALVVKPAKKDELNTAKEDATKLDKSDYTEESWKAVEDALAEIEALEKDENALQSKVDAAKAKLTEAVSNLQKVEKPEPSPEPSPNPEVKKVASVALSTTTYTYNGKVKAPKVVAKNNKKEVIPASSYSVKYASGRKNVGKYTVTVTFKNGYTGKYTKTFQIVPKGTRLKSVKAGKKSFTAKWSKQATQTTGYQVQYSTSKNFKKSVKTSTISKNKTVSKTVKKLSAKKTYYVRVRTYKTVKVGGKSVKLYSGWSVAKKVKVK